MKKSKETAKQMHIMTLDMVSMVKNLQMPNIYDEMSIEEKTAECLRFIKSITKVSHLCQDIAWTAETFRDAVYYESWNAVLEEMADEMEVK